jgi:hypothetical protein
VDVAADLRITGLISSAGPQTCGSLLGAGTSPDEDPLATDAPLTHPTCEWDSSGAEVDVRSGLRLFVGERDAPAGEITKTGRVAEDFN